MPKKDAKYDKEVKTKSPDLKTKRGKELYKMRRDTDKLIRETRDSVLEKNRTDLLMASKKEKERAAAAKKARGGKPALSTDAQLALLRGQKPKKKKSPPKDFHYEYK
jgi:hypothetical protein